MGRSGTDHDDGSRSPVEHGHRDVAGGAARAAVFGISDGLVSNVGLIVGVAGAERAAGLVRVAGLAGLLAGAISMAAGEYNSMRVQRELFERELSRERLEIEHNPSVEADELAQRYQRRGMDAGLAQELSDHLMGDPELALDFHAREELGVDPGNLGSPLGAAGASFAAFTVGALVPLLPWFVLDGTAALVVTLVLALASALAIGAAIARFTERSPLRSMVRQVLFTAVPAGLTFLLGSLLGVNLD